MRSGSCSTVGSRGGSERRAGNVRCYEAAGPRRAVAGESRHRCPEQAAIRPLRLRSTLLHPKPVAPHPTTSGPEIWQNLFAAVTEDADREWPPRAYPPQSGRLRVAGSLGSPWSWSTGDGVARFGAGFGVRGRPAVCCVLGRARPRFARRSPRVGCGRSW